MKKRLSLVLLAALAVSQSVAQAQNKPHPEKKVYANVESWPATAPGDVELKHFQPFRAVYDRKYTQGLGAGAGQKRQDRVIVHAEEVGWEGRRAAAITMLDTGEAKYADTNMRALTMVTDLENLQVLFEMGPLPGKAKDYYIGRLDLLGPASGLLLFCGGLEPAPPVGPLPLPAQLGARPPRARLGAPPAGPPAAPRRPL